MRAVALALSLALVPVAQPSMPLADQSASGFPAPLIETAFDAIPGWARDDHAAAFSAFLQTCARDRAPRTRLNGVDGEAIMAVCQAARALPAQPTPAQARQFFETHFVPMAVEAEGLLTGYFEPQLSASETPTATHRYPLYRLPSDLVELPQPATELGLPETLTWGRRRGQEGQASFAEFPDRGAIMAGALEGQGLEIAWLSDPVDVFFTHIQGSARLAMTDGTVRRVNFAGKSGHAYTPIGRTLVERGAMALEDVTMQSIRQWLADAPETDRDAVLASNRSYIFFAIRDDDAPHLGPTAAAGVPLTPERSLAVDRRLHTFGSPIFVHGPDALPGEDSPLQRLMIAQDTGSAIVGPARGDIFLGSGDDAGDRAGVVNMPVNYVVLVPKQISPVRGSLD